jgi:hypothetical protein
MQPAVRVGLARIARQRRGLGGNIGQIGQGQQIVEIAERRLVLAIAHHRQMVDHEPHARMRLGDLAQFGQEAGCA